MAPQVWAHERAARQRGGSLVLEISDPRKGAGRALERVWRRHHRSALQLLDDIYLLRVPLKRFGFREVFQLTPYLAMGEPLLLSWSELGQTLSAPELRTLETEALLWERLATFFDEVRAGRPRAPGHRAKASSAALERKFEELRRAARLLRRGESQRGGFTEIRNTEAKDARPTRDAQPTGMDSPRSSAGLAQHTAVRDIAASWQTWLSAARKDYDAWFAQHEMSADGTLESLAELDAFVDASPANQQQACAHLASIAVYLADIVCEQRCARFYADTSETQLLSSLKLELNGRDARPTPLLERLFEVLQDPERSVFGLGVELCRLS